MQEKWSLLDGDLREIVKLSPNDIKIKGKRAVFRRPNNEWFYEEQHIILFRETLETLTDVKIKVNGIFKGENNELMVDCSIIDLNENENRRKEPRQFVEVDTMIESTNLFEFGTVIDLSNSGAKVELSKDIEIEIGSVFTIFYTVDDKEYSRRGIVRWVLVKEDCAYLGMQFYK